MLIDLLWFLLGAAISAILYRAFRILPALTMIKRANLAILTMYHGFEKAYRKTLNGGKEKDECVLTAWQELAILLFFETYPQEFHKLLPFRNWEEAMMYLERENKKNKRA
jgi:hypothetical protein